MRVPLLLLIAPCLLQPKWRTSLGIRLSDGGHPIVAVGDTIRLIAQPYRCASHECLAQLLPARSVVWRSSKPRIATVDAQGLLRAGEAGTLAVHARSRGLSASLDVVVLPPVARLVRDPMLRVPRVGDTLRVSWLAIDAKGALVRRIPASAHIGGTGRTGEVQSYDALGYTVVVIQRPGMLELVGKLGGRVDTLRMIVR